MAKQLIISVAREFGSGGHIIAQELAKRFDLPFYDKNILEHIESEKQLKEDSLKQYDEMPRSYLFSRTVRGYNSSPAENVAQMQFDYLRKKAAAGESFVIVGRCAEEILRDCPALISIFVLADPDFKVKRIMKLNDVPAEEAKTIISRNTRKRKMYHNYYCDIKWGDSRGYDLCINSGTTGLEKAADILEEYIKIIQSQREENK